ncbi:MAG: glycoside hydrolase family 13 protein [Spirochaetia bacterium]
MNRTWWKEAIVYQIYPRSFQDSNGDGIGDIPGVIQRLDYIASIGIDVIWLNPVYQSPNDDNGYDISDYYSIMEEFGTMSDWDELLFQVHKRDMKLIMDLVVNHTSDEHQWFMESRKSKENPYRDYYIWKQGKPGKEPNNWRSVFGGSAWEYDEATGEYYLHVFSKKQPDLNWENPKLRDDVMSMVKWWLDKGIDGFRLDAINLIAKDPGFPDGELKPGERYADGNRFFHNLPKMHQYLQEMNKTVLSKYDIMTVGEAAFASPEEALRLAGQDRGELDMVFTFYHMFMDLDETGRFGHSEWKLSSLKAYFKREFDALFHKAWGAVYFGNHDFPRQVSRFGNDGEYRKESAKAFMTLLFTLPGTPFLYQGDELGMTNAYHFTLDDYQDVETLNFIREKRNNGMGDNEILKILKHKSRDNARTPVQWDTTVHAGFSSVSPWLPVNPNYTHINAETESKDPDSVLNYTRKLIKFRKEHIDLVYSDFNLLLPDDESFFAYIRKSTVNEYLVIVNLSDNPKEFLLEEYFTNSKYALKALSGREDAPAPGPVFLPYESRVYGRTRQ